MQEINIDRVNRLLDRAQKDQIRIMLENDRLSVKGVKGKKIGKDFLDELNAGKADLAGYFRQQQNQPGPRAMTVDKAFIEERDGKSYYQVSNENIYWLDDANKQYKKEFYALISYHIGGNLDMDIFSRALSFVRDRHESLRATFHKLGENYYMRVEDSGGVPPDGLEILDLRDLKEDKPGKAERFTFFKDHVFDVQKGPLFVVRMAQVEDGEYQLSFKLPHVIYDGWSLEILMRDLIVAYGALAAGQDPELPVLEFQYKEYMSFCNRYVHDHFEGHTAYWESLYPALPEELIIPGRKEADSNRSCRPARDEIFPFPRDLAHQLKHSGLSVKYAASVQVLMEAVIRGYFYLQTGQNDMAIGMLGFGRDLAPGLNDQIGNYSRSHLTRVILHPQDCFGDIVKKVKKAHQDAKVYWGKTMVGFLSERLAIAGRSLSSVWKIDLYYKEEAGFTGSGPPSNGYSSLGITSIRGIPHPDKEDRVTDQEIKLVIVDHGDSMGLHVLYDTGMYDSAPISNLVRGLFGYMQTKAF